MVDFKDCRIDFICFGEASLQGFDSFNWEVDHDY